MIPVSPLSFPQPVTPNERFYILGEGRLLQIQPTQVSDSGRYLCVASNVAGEDDQDFTVLIQGVWGQQGPVGCGTGVARQRWGVSVLLEWPGRAILFRAACTPSHRRLAGMALRPLAWALSLTDFVTREHLCPVGLGFAFVKWG